jgi:Beta-galactosidase
LEQAGQQKAETNGTLGETTGRLAVATDNIGELMRNLFWAVVLMCLFGAAASAKVVVYSQAGFPTVASQPISRATLSHALEGMDVVFADQDALRDAKTLQGAELLVLPYGSAFPAEAWASIHGYLRSGGNVLVLGGQPFHVPVTLREGKFEESRPQDSYARQIEFKNTYAIPVPANLKFEWKTGYSFLGKHEIHARRFFTVEGSLNGLGFMVDKDGVAVAAPVIVADHTAVDHFVTDDPGNATLGSRLVALDFEPAPGYWDSPDGISLVREAADYARQGATSLWTELQYSTIKPFEPVQVTVHFRNSHSERVGEQTSGVIKLELLSGERVIDKAEIPFTGRKLESDLFFRKQLQPGFYVITAEYEEHGKSRESYQNGFWVEDESLLTSGPVFGVKADFLTRDGKPFFPVGTNYFTTEDQNWDFSSSRNAWVWERDFAEMELHGVNFVRTGVWIPTKRFVEPGSDAVNERFLRNLEAFLFSARRHNIIVNFTFFAFAPHVGMIAFQNPSATPPNPYLDPIAVRGEQDYVVSIVSRFKNSPFVSWDLINEPSFSNPRRLWKGNTPNRDSAEMSAWHNWLRKKYSNIAELASAWAVTPEQLGSFDSVPLPSENDLAFDRYGNANHVRAFDYNMFAQEMFAGWVRSMVSAIRTTGSTQLVNVGQDEGGVSDRVLNQFYADAGVAFTTNHTYWHDDALLWDSVVAKRPGMPNITGETGYQPVWGPDGTWRYDELTGFPLQERKWALGFAAGSSGALQWDWAREVDFGMKRSDFSAKIWEFAMRDMGQFAEKAAPAATGLIQSQVAIILPQSLQLSSYNQFSLDAQQRAVRALYHYARSEAYAVGEYQLDTLGDPKLIILPAPWVMNAESLRKIADKVREGATLVVSGPFDLDPHFHATGLRKEFGLDYTVAPLTTANDTIQWAGGVAQMSYSGDKPTYLSRAVLPSGDGWSETKLGKGTVLFVPLPLELNDNLWLTGEVYKYAMNKAGVARTYSTNNQDAGILICPTRFPHATLYVLTSEASSQDVSFTDLRSGKQFRTALGAGRAAMILVGEDGRIIASYNWNQR